MTQPETGPATLEGAKRAANVDPLDPAEDSTFTPVVEAVNALVRGWPVSQLTADVPEPWPANVEHGANMLAARLWRRKDSPSGVAAFGAEGPFYVQRNDPDVAMLLGLGAYAPPAVG